MPITLVGDTDQMMFRFQGAKPELILSDVVPFETIKLEINYRSTDQVINACQRLIAHNYSDKFGPYPQEFMKDVSGVKGEGKAISFKMLDTPEEESRFIAENILAEISNGYEPGDFFVGARTKAQLAYLEGELFRAGIKFINIASNGSFWQSRHVKVLVDYLRLAYNWDDQEALKTVCGVPSNNHPYTWNDKKGRFKKGDYASTRYLGVEFLNKIDYRLDNIEYFLSSNQDAWRYKTNDKDYWEIGPSKAQDLLEYVSKLTEFIDHCNYIGLMLQEISDTSVVGLMLQEISDTSVEKWLKHTEGISDDDTSNGKLDDLKTVIEIASDYDDIDKFLSYVDDMIQAAQDAKDKDWSDYVIISTYHKLKGLERPIVFGMGWCEGEDEYGPVGLLPHTFSLREPPNFGVLPGGGQNSIEDERCIAFVCVSRAIEKVYLTGTRTYRDWKLGPSRFISELGVENDSY